MLKSLRTSAKGVVANMKAAQKKFEEKKYAEAVALYTKTIDVTDTETHALDLGHAKHLLCFSRSLYEYAVAYAAEYHAYMEQREDYLESVKELLIEQEELQSIEEIVSPDEYFALSVVMADACSNIARSCIIEEHNRFTRRLKASKAKGLRFLPKAQVTEEVKDAIRPAVELYFSARYTAILCKLETGESVARLFASLFDDVTEYGISVMDIPEGSIALYTFFTVLDTKIKEKRDSRRAEYLAAKAAGDLEPETKINAPPESRDTRAALERGEASSSTDTSMGTSEESSDEDPDLANELTLIDLAKDLHRYYTERLAASKLMVTHSLFGRARPTEEGAAIEEEARANLAVLEEKLYALDCDFCDYIVYPRLAEKAAERASQAFSKSIMYSQTHGDEPSDASEDEESGESASGESNGEEESGEPEAEDSGSEQDEVTPREAAYDDAQELGMADL